MSGWLLILIVLIAIILFIKVTNKGQNFWSFLVVAGVLFLLVSVVYVATSTPNLSLSSFEGVTHLGKVYVAWLGQFFTNMAHITGNAVHLEWGLNVTHIKQ